MSESAVSKVSTPSGEAARTGEAPGPFSARSRGFAYDLLSAKQTTTTTSSGRLSTTFAQIA